MREVLVEKRGLIWGGVMLALIFLAYLLPYTVLRGVDSVYGSFLLWSVFGLLAIVVNFMISKNWRD